jgi:hypothetical protein
MSTSPNIRPQPGPRSKWSTRFRITGATVVAERPRQHLRRRVPSPRGRDGNRGGRVQPHESVAKPGRRAPDLLHSPRVSVCLTNRTHLRRVLHSSITQLSRDPYASVARRKSADYTIATNDAQPDVLGRPWAVRLKHRPRVRRAAAGERPSIPANRVPLGSSPRAATVLAKNGETNESTDERWVE